MYYLLNIHDIYTVKILIYILMYVRELCLYFTYR